MDFNKIWVHSELERVSYRHARTFAVCMPTALVPGPVDLIWEARVGRQRGHCNEKRSPGLWGYNCAHLREYEIVSLVSAVAQNIAEPVL